MRLIIYFLNQLYEYSYNFVINNNNSSNNKKINRE